MKKGSEDWKELEEILPESSHIQSIRSIGGGCDSEAYLMEIDEHGKQKKYFLKTNRDQLEKFKAEVIGLQSIEQTNTIKVPSAITCGKLSSSGKIFLVMEYLENLQSMGDEKQFGMKLAQLHLSSTNETRFGFDINNWCGENLQINDWCSTWQEFYREKRLGFQQKLVIDRLHDSELAKMIEQIKSKVGDILQGISIRPSLIHGDLWSGNWSFDRDGNPVIYDPCPYYAHHEEELSILTMFGSPSSAFWKGYRHYIPEESGFQDRLLLYQLYHYLNHYTIFQSGGYRSQSIAIIQKLLSKY